jgi:hypothetical protein
MIWKRGEKSSGNVQHVAAFQVLPRTMACGGESGPVYARPRGKDAAASQYGNGSQSDGSGERYGATRY